jgi:prepilin-type N-terminal cleavage/methylation domain-containing protein
VTGFTLIELLVVIAIIATLRIARLHTWLLGQPAVPNTDRDLSRFFTGVPQKLPIP